MMTPHRHSFALSALAVSLAACSAPLMHYTGYHGDGTFSPHAAPSWACRDGYTLDLGPVDLGAANATTRVLDGLPAMEAAIGLAVERRSEGAGGASREVFTARPAPLIEVTLRDADGRIVLSRHERLAQWIGSRALGEPGRVFLSQRGTETEIPVAPGAVRVERFPIGRDDSWGTYFKPRRDQRYTLHFAVEEPDANGEPLRDIEVRLQVRGVADCL